MLTVATRAEASSKQAGLEPGLSQPVEAPRRGDGAVGGSVDKDGKPVKEKTFFEKNWMILAALGLLLVNILAKPPPAAPLKQPEGGAPAASAAGSQ